jgi:hypothetical protein
MFSIYQHREDGDAQCDLSAARRYLAALSLALREAAELPEPRVVALGLAVAKYALAKLEAHLGC